MAEEAKKGLPTDIAGLMESAFMMGIGVMEITKDKMSGLSDELIERGKMSQSDAKKMADRMSEAAGKQQDSLRKTVAEEVGKAMESAGVPTRDDLAALREEIAELRSLLSAQMPAPPTPAE